MSSHALTDDQAAWITASDYTHFTTQVLEASYQQPILVDFWADWCSPCHSLTPHLHRVIADYAGAIRLVTVEVDQDDNMKLAGHYRLRGFPSVLLFHHGRECGRFSGARSSPQIRDWLYHHSIIEPSLNKCLD
jgi:putative thioredoxin